MHIARARLLDRLSNPHVTDYKGDVYARMFAEDGTGYARLLICATKSTADLLAHLLQMERWVLKMLPSGRFMVLRSDFGSELVVIVVEALSRWCSMRPGFCVCRPFAVSEQDRKPLGPGPRP